MVDSRVKKPKNRSLSKKSNKSMNKSKRGSVNVSSKNMGQSVISGFSLTNTPKTTNKMSKSKHGSIKVIQLFDFDKITKGVKDGHKLNLKPSIGYAI